MQITKKEIIQKLYEIEETQGIKTGREVQKVVRNEIIPVDIIKLINNYDTNFLKIYDTYNTIYKSRYKNPLYRNLRNNNISVRELAVALSSLVTRIAISCTKIEDAYDRHIFAEAMNLEEINKAIERYLLHEDATLMIKCVTEIRELLKLLYEED